jgi:hypothetical protein
LTACSEAARGEGGRRPRATRKRRGAAASGRVRRGRAAPRHLCHHRGRLALGRWQLSSWRERPKSSSLAFGRRRGGHGCDGATLGEKAEGQCCYRVQRAAQPAEQRNRTAGRRCGQARPLDFRGALGVAGGERRRLQVLPCAPSAGRRPLSAGHGRLQCCRGSRAGRTASGSSSITFSALTSR